MKLVYTQGPMEGQEVKVGDRVNLSEGEVEVVLFRPPHKPSASGRVTVRYTATKELREYYVSIIGAEWVEREDRP